MNKVYFIAWIRWSWKNTLISKLTQDYPYEFAQALSVKTREYRPSETPWVDYIKYSKERFRRETQIIPTLTGTLSTFLESNEHFGEFYGTRKKEIEEVLKSGKNVLKEIDPQGLIKIFRNIQSFPFQWVFIDIPDDIIEERMLTRNPYECMKNIQKSRERAGIERETIEEIQYLHGSDSILHLDGNQQTSKIVDHFISHSQQWVVLHS